MFKGISDQTYIHANPKRGVEGYIDVGNLRLSHEISSQGLTDSVGKLTKGLHKFNPAQKYQESQTEEVMDINTTPVLQSKTQNFGLTVEKLATITVIWYAVYKIVREIGPPC